MSARALLALLLAAALASLGGSCGGGGGGGGGPACDGSCPQESLSKAEVETIVAQAVAEAGILGEAATIAVVDRVGNVLAVFQMPGAAATTTITSQRGVVGGLEGFAAPATLAAISKAGTAAYLSTQGHAFSTRTASQIVQENFNPGETGRPGGPLFGVQLSQLPCGDLVRRDDSDMLEGPKRMPLGFSADPGGLPLFENGVPVGGVGVVFDGVYGLDPVVTDVDVDREERVAWAATRGFEAPQDRRATRIAVDGKFLRFADDTEVAFTSADAFALLPGGLVAVPDFYEPVPLEARPGVLFGTDLSGVASTTFEGLEAEILVDSAGVALHPPTAAGGAPGLLEPEVRAILREALRVAFRARAQIRRPAGSRARVTISVVGADGEILGIVRSPDAPVFGIDVSLQKARTAAFFSRGDAAAKLGAAGQGSFVAAAQAFLPDFGGLPALANGLAFSDRAGGNLSRPFFPDGINGHPNGPFSLPFPDWSPFSTGLQLEIVAAGVLASLADPTVLECDAALPELANGIQIFPGSVPIYKGSDRVGGIGVSGDGVDQDDLIAFLGLHEAGVLLGSVGNAPPAIRADNVVVDGVNLRYVNCPASPFLDSTAQNVCGGK